MRKYAVLKNLIVNPFKSSINHILDGKSEIGAHVLREIGDLIWLRHLLRSRAVENLKTNFRKVLFSFKRAQHVLS